MTVKVTSIERKLCQHVSPLNNYTAFCLDPLVTGLWFLGFALSVVSVLQTVPYRGPAVVILDGVDGQGDHLNATLTELAAQPGSSAQLRGAHRGVVSGVGEQDSPSGVKRSEAESGQVCVVVMS